MTEVKQLSEKEYKKHLEEQGVDKKDIKDILDRVYKRGGKKNEK